MLKKHELVEKILFSTEEINKRIVELAHKVSTYYQDNKEPVILVGILKGCLPFLAQFMLNLTVDCLVDFMYVKSYSGQTKAVNEPEIKVDVTNDIKKRDILIVEDIIDSGNSLVKIRKHLITKGAKTVKIITLLDKKDIQRKNDLKVDWYGFKVSNVFLIGYGLDYAEKLRNLPYVATANMEKIAKIEKK